MGFFKLYSSKQPWQQHCQDLWIWTSGSFCKRQGAHLGTARFRIKALRPQSYHLFRSLMSYSTSKHSGNMSREWAIWGKTSLAIYPVYITVNSKNENIWVYVIEPRLGQREMQVFKFLFVKQQRNQIITKIPFDSRIFWLKLDENYFSVFFSPRSENQC